MLSHSKWTLEDLSYTLKLPNEGLDLHYEDIPNIVIAHEKFYFVLERENKMGGKQDQMTFNHMFKLCKTSQTLVITR
jgi:hypothetical protein